VGETAAGTSGVHEYLREIAREVHTASDVDTAFGLLKGTDPEVVIVSESVSTSDAMMLLKKARAFSPQTPVVVVTEVPSVAHAVRFIREGAYDYIGGPLDSEKLGRLSEGIRLERARAGAERTRYFHPQCPPSVEIVGHSEGIVQSLELIRLIAESRCNPVLILGETGTGKELAAKGVHAWRCGDAERFVAINCAALTANLLESELFGHVKGSFTGADREKTGLFELAASGSIFLDEISEMPLDLQPKLLRVLQEKTFRKVGGTKDIPCDATIITSSNRDLRREVQERRFREDLYYRLAVFPVTIPPLRSPQRCDDIPLLAEYFIETSNIPAARGITGLSKGAMHELLQHDWPGNVRELANAIQRAIILEKSKQITPSSLFIEHRDGAEAQAAAKKSVRPDFSLEAAEREFILRALKETGWQRTRAAALLGITRATLHAKLKRYEIKVPGGRTLGGQRSESADSDLPLRRGSVAPSEGRPKT
jgi:two-component system response regulator HydG